MLRYSSSWNGALPDKHTTRFRCYDWRAVSETFQLAHSIEFQFVAPFED